MTANADRPFLVKIASDRIVQAPNLRVTHRELRKVKRVIPGLGQEMEHSGWDPSQLVIAAVPVYEGTDHDRRVAVHVVNAYGRHGSSGQRLVPATASGVQSVARRLDDNYAADLDRVDDAIVVLEEQIAALRRERKAIVSRAWTNAVRLWVDDVAPEGDDHRRVVAADATATK